MKTLMMTVLMLSMSSAFAQSAQQKKEAKAIDTLIKAAQALSATDLSCQRDADCSVVEFGSMACGGPVGGLVLSSKNLNAAEVELLAKASVEKEQAFNVKWNVFGICIAPAMPNPKCVAKVCQDIRLSM